MLAERALPTDLDARIAALGRAWSSDPDVAAVYLFGSRAEGRAGPRSDVDLAVVLGDTSSAEARWRKRLALIGDATQRLRTDAVDVIVLEDAPILLAHRVLARGRLLGETDPQRRRAVAEHVMRRYLDEAPLRAVLDTALARRVREGHILRAMERALRTLRQLRAQGRAAFESDEAVQDRADRNAQLLAQGCADIALHVVAASGTAAPETYAEALARLGALGIIALDLAERLAAAVRLRNILVHGYLDIDHGRLYDELGWIEDTAMFAAAIEQWLTTHEAS